MGTNNFFYAFWIVKKKRILFYILNESLFFQFIYFNYNLTFYILKWKCDVTLKDLNNLVTWISRGHCGVGSQPANLMWVW